MIEGFFGQAEELGEKEIVGLFGEQRDLRRRNVVRTALGLDDPGGFFILHAFGGTGEERMQIFPGLRLDPPGKGVEVWGHQSQAALAASWARSHS